MRPGRVKPLFNMKESFYFQHDFNARNDPKLQDVFAEHGIAGIGVFWCIVEMLYEQDGRLPLKSCKGIAFALQVDCKVVESIVNDFNLFVKDDESFWSESIEKRLSRRKNISEKRKQAAANRWQSATKENEQSPVDAIALQNDAIQRKEKENNNNISSNEDKSTCVDETAQKRDFIVDYARIIAAWKECCPGFPQPRSLADDDKAKVRQRFNEMFDKNKDTEKVYQRIREIFKKVGASDFCKSGKWCSFRWVFKNATNWRKVEDGNYDNAGKGNNNLNVNDEWT